MWDGVMFFLLRTAFWLSIVLALLPTGGSQPKSNDTAIDPIEAVSAAGAAVSDMSQFCARQPDACVVGAQAASAFGHRAQAGAKMVYDFLSERMVPADTVSTPAETGSVTPTKASASHTGGTKGSRQTLKPADLEPAWRGPAPKKDAKDGKDGKRPAA